MAKHKKTAKELATMICDEIGDPPGELHIFPLRGGKGWWGFWFGPPNPMTIKRGSNPSSRG